MVAGSLRWVPLFGSAVVVLGMGLVGCRKGPSPKAAAKIDADQVIERMRTRPVPAGLQAKYKIRIEGPGAGGSTRGAMMVQDPDHLRLEVLTPLRTPLLTVASDGTSLHAWSQQHATFYRGDEAATVLAEVTSGAVNISDVVTLLTGGLPFPTAPVLATGGEEGGVELLLGGPDDTRMRAVVAPWRGFVRLLEVGKALTPGGLEMGPPILQVEVLEAVRVGKYILPQELVITLPTLGWTVEMSFTSWTVLDEVSPVFVLPAPKGAKQADLVETLQEIGEKHKESGGTTAGAAAPVK